MTKESTSKAYLEAGVSLDAGYESVSRIKKHLEKTKRLGVMGSIGAFGGLFDLSALNYKKPVLVSGTDGVGTKLKLAFMMDKHDTIGQDVVAMCVNDVLASGARPLFFLDYIACDKNNPAKIEQIVKGVAQGCELAEAGLIGGETAEMPDMYTNDEYDIAGFTVGVVEKDQMITPEKTKAGQAVIGLASSGVHSNGFSLVRKIVLKDNHIPLDTYYPELKQTLGEALLTPTTIYVKPVLAVLKQVDVAGIAHITGGGFYENMPRCLDEGLGVKIKNGSFPVLEIFKILQKLGNLTTDEMYHIYNMGIGMILVVDQKDKKQVLNILAAEKQLAYEIGEVTNQKGVVIYD